MAQVSVTFNKRTYRFDCADSDAARLELIAGYLKDKLDALSREHGAIGDERIVLMAALMVTDELFEARAQRDESEGKAAAPPKDSSESMKADRAQTAALRKAGS